MIAFTICSNNYLAQAAVLGNSYLKYHPSSKFIIGLVDKLDDEFDAKMFANFDIIPVEHLEIPEFVDLNLKYNITELNTSVKPEYFKYIFKKYNAKKLIYLDPDILVFSAFEEIESLLNTKNIILTPHILSPVEDEFTPTDYQTLRGGVFNLGFIALSDYEYVKDFLEWWADRVKNYGYSDFGRNMFYDQLWINYVPCFYDNFHILKHAGYNVANWNLHERLVTRSSEKFMINNVVPLCFFHYSGYDFQKPSTISKHLTRFNFINRPDLTEIFTLYNQLLIKANIRLLSKAKVFYYPQLGMEENIKKEADYHKITDRIVRALKILKNGHY